MKVATGWQPHFDKRTCEDTQTTSTSFSGPLGEGTDEHSYVHLYLLFIM